MAAAAEGLALLTEYQHAQLQGAGIQRPVEIIPFGVDLADYRFDPDRFPREPFRLLFVGNLIPVKNPDFLIRVAGALRARCDFTMEILGQDRLEGSMQRLAAELGIADCVQFHGYQPHRIVRDRLLEADALLLVSLHEAQGVAAAEAAAAGVLIAGTRVGLLDDLAPTGALVVDDGEPERFADILLSALRDRAVYRSHIQAARAWIERHDADSCAAEYRTVYRRLAFPGARGTSSEPE
jgi:glycosyltransferase involved in cell wall biosynthesis